jgi:amino acid adenylation domain-containing protein/thioester reductase-like protein
MEDCANMKISSKTDLLQQQTIVQLFEEQVNQKPDNIAVTFLNHSLTYSELNKRANQLARFIRKQYKNIHNEALKPDTLIAIYFNRCLEMIVVILAILKAGAAYVPIDPNFPKNRIFYMLQDSNPDLLITLDCHTREIKVLSENIQNFPDCVSTIENQKIFEKESTKNLTQKAWLHNLAYVIYTSGSTGQPKGIMIEYKSLANIVNHIVDKLPAKLNYRYLQFHSISFDASVYDWAAALTHGLELILLSEHELPPYMDITDILEEKNINIVILPPSLLATTPYRALPNLLLLISAGEKCTQHIADRWGHKRIFINGYGPTETTVFSTFDLYRQGSKITIGRPIDNTILYIFDENLTQVPKGKKGELYIGGVGLARGYLNQPSLTKERFINYKGTRLYKTGDIVRELPDGRLDYIGRNDEQVKIRGYRIELGEIESILKKHSHIIQAVVMVMETKALGKSLIGYYSLKPNEKLDEAKLRNFLAKYLPKYMIPTFLVEIKEFPLTPSHKIDRKKLPDPLKVKKGKQYKLNFDENENKLINIWHEVLGVDKNDINIHDNFFNLGGHSLLVSRMILAVEQQLNVTIPLNNFIIEPTISNLNKLIKKAPGNINKQALFDRIAKDIYLEPMIGAPRKTNNNIYNPKAVLLTGGSGFLGIYLLKELITKTKAIVYCLVRGSNQNEATKKLYHALSKHKLNGLIKNHRIKIILGDLEKPLIGVSSNKFKKLAEQVDCIYHCGAYVHHLYDYQQLFKANVQSVKELLKLASVGKKKAFHYISTVSCVSNFDKRGYAKEACPTKDFPKSLNGYSLTKWAAERMLCSARKKDIIVTIYRPGNITGDIKNGISNPEKNHLLLLLKSCIQLEIAPDWDICFDMTSVDLLSQAIVELSLRPESNGKTYNMHNPRSPSWRQVIKWIKEYGFSIKMVKPKIWYAHIRGIGMDNALYPLLPYYLNGCSSELKEIGKIKYQKTQKALQKLNIIYPKYGKQYVFKILDYLIDTKFIQRKV